MDIFLIFSIAKLANKIVNARREEHAVHVSMATHFTTTNAFNVLKQVEVSMDNVQGVVLKPREPYWLAQIAQM